MTTPAFSDSRPLPDGRFLWAADCAPFSTIGQTHSPGDAIPVLSSVEATKALDGKAAQVAVPAVLLLARGHALLRESEQPPPQQSAQSADAKSSKQAAPPSPQQMCEQALRDAETVLASNLHGTLALVLKAAALGRLSRGDEAMQTLFTALIAALAKQAEAEAAEWICSRCTLANAAASKKCEACGLRKRSPSSPSILQPQQQQSQQSQQKSKAPKLPEDLGTLKGEPAYIRDALAKLLRSEAGLRFIGLERTLGLPQQPQKEEKQTAADKADNKSVEASSSLSAAAAGSPAAILAAATEPAAKKARVDAAAATGSESSSSPVATAGAAGDSKSEKPSKPKICRLFSELTCPCCDSFLFKPVTLPCGHSLCENCIRFFFKFEDWQTDVYFCYQCYTASRLSRAKTPCIILTSCLENSFPNESKVAKAHKEAVAAGKTQEQLSAIVSALPGNFMHLISEASDCWREKNPQGAVAKAEQAIKINPLHYSPHFWRGYMLLIGLNRFEGAIQPLAVALSLANSAANRSMISGHLAHALIHTFFKQRAGASVAAAATSATGASSASPAAPPATPSNTNNSSSSDSGSAGSGSVAPAPAAASSTDSKRVAEAKSDLSALAGLNVTSLRKIAQDYVAPLRAALPPNQHSVLRVLLDTPSRRAIAKELQCLLCMSLLFEPVTTVCGHTFCRVCLARALDHKNLCPFCRHPLSDLISPERQCVNATLRAILLRFCPKGYEKRRLAIKAELDEQELFFPIFVCNQMLPGIPCDLHIYEPRYRLMIRSVMESGFQRFGMCTYVDHLGNYAAVGTTAEIRRVELLPDGRSLVYTVGGRRFLVKERSQRHGYNVAKVEWFDDLPEDKQQEMFGSATPSLQTMIARVQDWVDNKLLPSLGPFKVQDLERSYGPLPNITQNPTLASYWLCSALAYDEGATYEFCQLRTQYERYQSLLEMIDNVRLPAPGGSATGGATAGADAGDGDEGEEQPMPAQLAQLLALLGQYQQQDTARGSGGRGGGGRGRG